MSGIFNPSIFNNAVFNTGAGVVVVQPVVKTGTGGIDPEKRRRIFKPTGLVDRKPEGKKGVEQRVLETRDIQSEIDLGQLIERSQVDFRPIKEMTSSEVDREIAFLMKEKMNQIEEEEMMDIIKMLASD